MEDHDSEVEVPQYFVCPISLQIMKDPVTAATGITYDRCSIERWLKDAAATSEVGPVCPVTKQPLPDPATSTDHGLTPNHTLRRLIQAWCVANASLGVQRIPTPKPVLCRAHLLRILRSLTVPHLQSAALDQLLSFTSADDHQHVSKLMVDCGVIQAMVSLIIKCHKQSNTMFLRQALVILTAIWNPFPGIDQIIDIDLFDALTWVLLHNDNVEWRTLAINLLKEVVKVAGPTLIQRLKPEFFKAVVGILLLNKNHHHHGNANANNSNSYTNHDDHVSTTKAAIEVLLAVSNHGRNKYRIIEANTIFHLIDLEFEKTNKKKLSELVFCLLAQLCSCADGRAQLLAHCGAIAVLSKSILRVSPVVDDRAVHIFGLISKYSATQEVLHEMLKVGAVSKLCMVLQADCGKYLQDKVRDMLRRHSYVWNNSPCIQLYLLTSFQVDDMVVRCNCGLPVARRQSWIDRNPGRKFMACKYTNSTLTFSA